MGLYQHNLFAPKVEWEAPRELPDPSTILSSTSLVSIDTETKDPELKEKGAGGFRGTGHVVGISVCFDDEKPLYLPVRHAGGGNLPEDMVRRWLEPILASDKPKVGANLLYDLEMLKADGYTVNGLKYDVQVAEPILDENQFSFSLENLALKYLGHGKEEKLLKEIAKQTGIDEKSDLWQMPAGYVGPYAEKDALLPLLIFRQQRKDLEIGDIDFYTKERQTLWDVFLLESKLIDCLLVMKETGLRVDLERADELSQRWEAEEKRLLLEVKLDTGIDLDVWSNTSMSRYFDKLGIHYPRTNIGNPSFTAEFLDTLKDPRSTTCLRIRKLSKARQTFIDSMMKGYVDRRGRIHPKFKSVKEDDGGTRSGRLACADPNIQQVPARDPELGPAIRSCFLPEEGAQWAAIDYSQQEPRLTVHFAHILNLPGASEARSRYVDDPKTDYHQMVADMAGIPRKSAKVINLGSAYGMGIAKIIKNLGVSEVEGTDIYNQYHAGLPFIKPLAKACTSSANQHGYIKTILGRRRRFNLWEPADGSLGFEKPLPREMASAKWRNKQLRRAMTHKALNALIQGSAADMMKAAMVAIHEAGKSHLLHATVHDELGCSVYEKGDIDLIVDKMLNAVRMTVPLRVDVEVGPSWGQAKEMTS